MWLQIIAFIINFPALIKTILELVRLIRSLTGSDKTQYETQLSEFLKKCNQAKSMEMSDHDVLERMRQDILNKK
jgi:flagellar motor switch protein FliG